MNKVRKGVFETNSSSMHTLVMTSDASHEWVTEEDINAFLDDPVSTKQEYLVWNNDHTGYYLTIVGDSFGREFRLLNLWHAKLQYLAAAYGPRNITSIVDVLKEYLGPKFIGLLITTPEVQNYEDGQSTTYDNIEYPCLDYDFLSGAFGDIDHQSNGMIEGAIALINPNDQKDAIKKLLFNNRYVIVVDSDESCTFHEMLDSGYMEENSFTYILRERWNDNDDSDDENYNRSYYEFQPISEYLEGYYE